MLPSSPVAKSWFDQLLIRSAVPQWLCVVDLLMAQRKRNTLHVCIYSALVLLLWLKE